MHDGKRSKGRNDNTLTTACVLHLYTSPTAINPVGLLVYFQTSREMVAD